MNKILLVNLMFCFTLSACGGGGGGSSNDVVDAGDGKADAIDITPDSFSFSLFVGQELSSPVQSNDITLLGMDDNTAISIEGGMYSINSGEFTSDVSFVNEGDTLSVQVIAASDYQMATFAEVTVGTYSTNFSVNTRAKDITPEPFNFVVATNVEPNTDIPSNQITLEGIDTDTPISISQGTYQINNASYTHQEGVVSNGDQIRVLLHSESGYASNNSTDLMVGDYTARFITSTRNKDNTPNPFSFSTMQNVESSTQYTSNTVTLSGFDGEVAISIENGAYSINGSEFTTAPSHLSSDDTLAVQVTSSSELETQTQTVVKVGTTSVAFRVITRSQDITPNAFSFAAAQNSEPSTQYTSNTVTLAGFDDDVSTSIENGTYSINGGQFTSQPSQVKSGDTLALRVQSANEYQSQKKAVITVGSVTAIFSVTTRVQDITPSEIEFTAVKDSEPSTNNISNTITLAGIEGITNITISAGLYSLNGGEFTNGTGLVKNGDTLVIKVTSSAEFETPISAVVSVGDFTTSYGVTTRLKETMPSYTVPTSVTDVAINSYVLANDITFTKFDGDDITIIGAEYRLNEGNWIAAGTTTINENDVLSLRVLSSSSYSTQVSSSVNGNGWFFEFNVTTLEGIAPTVILNKAFEEDGSTPLNGSEELVLTFSQTMQKDTLVLSGDMVPDCNDQVDETNCLNLIWSEKDTVLTLSPKEDFYWYSDKRSLGVAITGDGALGLDETISATVLPIFETFHTADVVIGHSDFNSRYGSNGYNRFNSPYGISAYQKDNKVGLLISDTSNNRIVKYSTVPTFNGAGHDERFGQDLSTTNNSGSSSNRLYAPRSAIQLNDRIYIAEQVNDRASWVKISNFDVNGGLENSGKATSIVGQEDFGIVIDDQCSQSSLSNVTAIDVVETENGIQWLVVDNGNNRIMIWSNPDETKGSNASIVLGQENFDDCQGRYAYEDGEGLKSLKEPVGAWSNGEKLVVSSNGGNRLLVWNTFPTESNQLPDFQLGQETDIATAINASESIPNQRGMNGPRGIGGNNYQMCVVDNSNHRILVWSTLPENSDDLADIVIGQSNFTNSAGNDRNQDGFATDYFNDGRVLYYPMACDISMEQLFIADSGNNRVLVFNALNKRPINN